MTAAAALEGGPEARAEREFPALDGLRALAASAVVLTHASFFTGEHRGDAVGRVLARLDVGVPVFFVLAGFLLSRPFLRAGLAGTAAPRAVPYLWRRALRILPAYWLTVVLAMLLVPANRDLGAGQWVRHLLLLQVYDSLGFAEGLSHTWSLCTEVAFYLVLPLAAAGLVRLARRDPARPWPVLAALGATAVGSLVWLALVWGPAFSFVKRDLWLTAYAGWFAVGTALALLTLADAGWGPVRAARELAASPGTCWTGAAVLFWIACTPVAGPIELSAPTPAQAVVRNLLYAGVAGLLLLPLVLGPRGGRLHRALSGRPARFLGEISYGLFLLHVVLLTAAYALLGQPVFSGSPWLVVPATWLGGVAAATVLYVLVERPLRRFRHAADGLGRPPRGGRRRRSGSSAAATEQTAAATSTRRAVPVPSTGSSTPATATSAAAVPPSTAPRRRPDRAATPAAAASSARPTGPATSAVPARAPSSTAAATARRPRRARAGEGTGDGVAGPGRQAASPASTSTATPPPASAAR